MSEYYVIKDKNTGLYFRGKGVNRWGKYFNQASIYRVKGMAEHSIKEIAWHGEQAEVVPIQIFENTANVKKVVICSECKYKDECLQKVDCEYSNKEIVYCSYGERRKDNDV